MKTIHSAQSFLSQRPQSVRAGGILGLFLLFCGAGNAAQSGAFTYEVSGGTTTITKYTGAGGAVTIPDTIDGLPVTSLGPDAFYSCTGLISITIPDSVTTIGSAAFAWCTRLTSVTIPKSVTSIGDWAFWECASLPGITVDALNSVYSSVDGVLFNKSQTTLVQYLAGKAGSYTVPDSVTTIGLGAFYDCASLTSVTIPDSVMNIGSNAFSYSTNLISVTIGNSVVNLGHYAFAGCARLTGITIPKSVTNIGDNAFRDCISLRSATIPDSVTNIDSSAFRSCVNLTSVTIPDSVINIGGNAFSGCTRLATATIGKSVTSLGGVAFGYCTSLTGVYFKGNAPTIQWDFYYGLCDWCEFYDDAHATVYYLPGTTGWHSTFGGRPTVLWNPHVQTGEASFGVRTNQFGFTITGTSGLVVVVEACTDLANPVWSPMGTNTLTGGSSYFNDPQWMNYPARFYQFRSP